MRAEDSTSSYQTKYSWNLNTLLHLLFRRPVDLLPDPRIWIEYPITFPDVSFWQQEVNWDVLATQANAVVIRGSQGTWEDEQFERNWQMAREHKLKRGFYHFYDDRYSPGKQAAEVLRLIEDDMPEMEIWVDWERNYGGRYSGLKNVVAMMEAIEKQLFPTPMVGMYTGFYWFLGNSNHITHKNQYAYLAKHPLWLAQYDVETSLLRIPSPWIKARLHQYGTPALGHKYGVITEEIDMNVWVGLRDEFIQMYPTNSHVPLPPPEVPGEWRMVTASKLNIRNAPGVSNQDIGDLYKGMFVKTDKFQVYQGVVWYHLVDATTANRSPVNCTDGKPVSFHTDCWVSGSYLSEPIR